ncbi:unannotated protein [freshwater metagenome]|uniref:Unannotated protein n=1 Tax=freshwater metagenome TaxID=449393 RepID=A0A6J6L4B4_9ZZZZ
MLTISIDSGDRADQAITMTGLVLDRGRNSAVKFAAVTSKPGIAALGAALGLPSELKSTACAKFGGLPTWKSYWATTSIPESRLYGRISLM